MKLWGNGGIKLYVDLGVSGSVSVQFNNVQCNLQFKQQYTQNTTIDGYIHRSNIKYRGYITTIITICNGDQTKLHDLIDVINSSVYDGYIYVYPRYSVNNSEQISYICILDSSDIQPIAYSNLKVGQQIQLVFKTAIQQYIPTFTSQLYMYNMVDASGNQYVNTALAEYIMYS